jgi:hypothetical protein
MCFHYFGRNGILTKRNQSKYEMMMERIFLEDLVLCVRYWRFLGLVGLLVINHRFFWFRELVVSIGNVDGLLDGKMRIIVLCAAIDNFSFQTSSTDHHYHRKKLYQDSAFGVWNSCIPEYEVSFVFCSFQYISLNVFVSFFYFWRKLCSLLEIARQKTKFLRSQNRFFRFIFHNIYIYAIFYGSSNTEAGEEKFQKWCFFSIKKNLFYFIFLFFGIKWLVHV